MYELDFIKFKINYSAVLVLIKREILAFLRSKARIITSIAQGLFFLLVFSSGFSQFNIQIGDKFVDPKPYIASGITAMAILFTGMFGGLGLMRDNLFGFMKELMASPISRRTLMIGKTLGVAFLTLIQCIIFLIVSIIFGFFGYDITLIWTVLLIIPVALLAGIGIVGLSLIISTRIRDFQSFGLIQTFIVMPMFWLSGALMSINFFPNWMQIAMKWNPYTYTVDLFRFILLGVSFFPIWMDLLVMSCFGIIMILLGAWSFNKMNVS
ncbi:MAG: ABC transporter permease [Promethearchaeota archaeon]